jgi:hypothetical protein
MSTCPNFDAKCNGLWLFVSCESRFTFAMHQIRALATSARSDLRHEKAGQFPGVRIAKPDRMGSRDCYPRHLDLRRDREEVEQCLGVQIPMQSVMASCCPCLVNLHLHRTR